MSFIIISRRAAARRARAARILRSRHERRQIAAQRGASLIAVLFG